MSTTTFHCLERLSSLNNGDFSPKKEFFSMHEMPNPMSYSEPANFRPLLMEFDTHNKKNKLSSKNTKPEVCGHYASWPLPS
jgi:hypothetical protein